MNNGKIFFKIFAVLLLVIPGYFITGTSTDSDTNTAIVCFLDGKAWRLEPGGGDRREVKLFDWFKIGSVIETDPDAKIVLAFSNGVRFELGEKTRVTVGKQDFMSSTGIVKKMSKVLVMPNLDAISWESIPGSRLGGIRLRGNKKFITGLYPGEGATSLAEETVITFESLEGIEKYRVEIEDEWGTKVFSVETESPRIIVSPGVLSPGANYYWQVQTLDKDMPSSVSYEGFSTIKEENARILKAFRASISNSKDGIDLLLQSRIEAALGLKREMCASLKVALKFFPENKEIKEIMANSGCK